MKKELSLYYITRAGISVLVGVLTSLSGRPLWISLLTGLFTFGLFLWYAHSGYFLIDESTPLTPLRRDARGKVIRDRALLYAVVTGALIYGMIVLVEQTMGIAPEVKNLALLVGITAYFVISQALFARDAK